MIDGITLLFYSGCVYGMSWILTQSALFRPLRKAIGWKVADCLVCCSCWCSAAITALFWCSERIPVPGSFMANMALLYLLMMWSAFFCWVVGRMMGDAK